MYVIKHKGTGEIIHWFETYGQAINYLFTLPPDQRNQYDIKLSFEDKGGDE